MNAVMPVNVQEQSGRTGVNLGLLNVQTNADLQHNEEVRKSKESEARSITSVEITDSIASYVLGCFQRARDTKETSGVNERLIDALRRYEGTYSPDKLQLLRESGGTDIFMNITRIKTNAAESIITEALSQNSPWGIEPTPVANLPKDFEDQVIDSTMADVAEAVANGQQPSREEVFKHAAELRARVIDEIQKEAIRRSCGMSKKIEDILAEANFDAVLTQFISDLCIYGTAIIKGPIFRYKKQIVWEGSTPVVSYEPQMLIENVSVFDAFPSTKSCDIDGGSYFIEALDTPRHLLYSLCDVDGYNSNTIKELLRDTTSTQAPVSTNVDQERADLQDHPFLSENPDMTIHGYDYWGEIPGRYLKMWGVSGVKDDRDYSVNIVVYGTRTIRCEINPDPLGKRVYSRAVYKKRSGSFWGIGVPLMMKDVQDMCNAAARALVNNMGLASGPQVVINDVGRLADGEDITKIYPWKIWQFRDERAGGQDPVKFVNIESRAGELMGIYEKFLRMADDHTALPAYAYGSDAVAGAGRTSSGLAMLMESMNKGIKSTIINIDLYGVIPLIQRVFTYLMLYGDDDSIKGDCRTVVNGFVALLVKEQEYQKLANFMQLTGNPTDLQIIGIKGRANALRSYVDGLEIPARDVVPSEEAIERVVQQQEQQMAQAAQQQHMQQLQPGGQQAA